MSDVITVEQFSAAPQATIYRHLIESDLWVLWQGVSATLEPRPGGLFRMETPDGRTARGQFIELIPTERVVFSWGWTDMPGLPPGSTTVEIDLIPHDDGTLIRLQHHGLAPEEAVMHDMGWRHYLTRLSSASAGEILGPDTGPG
ncbi:MAG: SRPBCC family protein [Actinomycetota bacterium]|nr:SRPBCC family protein [Actinomycetota bacterium]